MGGRNQDVRTLGTGCKGGASLKFEVPWFGLRSQRWRIGVRRLVMRDVGRQLDDNGHLGEGGWPVVWERTGGYGGGSCDKVYSFEFRWRR